MNTEADVNAEHISDDVAEEILVKIVKDHAQMLKNRFGYDLCMSPYNVAQTTVELKKIFGRKVKVYTNGSTSEVTFVLKNPYAEETVLCASDEYLPCPFCGGEAKRDISYGLEGYYIMCSECGCRTANSNLARATIAWNKRYEKKPRLRRIME